MASVGFDADGTITGDTVVAEQVDDGAVSTPYAFVNGSSKAVRFVMHVADGLVVRDDIYAEGSGYFDGDSFTLPPYRSRTFFVSNPTGGDETFGMQVGTAVTHVVNNVVGSVYITEIS